MRGRVEIADLCVDYGPLRAVDGASFVVEPGTTLALVGPSGSGKSSLVQCVNRLIDLTPGARVSGVVRVSGADVRAPGSDVLDLRRRVGMVFQRPTPFPCSIRKNLELPLREHRLGGAAERGERSRAALEAVGLWQEVESRLDAPASRLSGGPQQRQCLARALVVEPEVLLLDEPCSSLDPLATAVVEEALRKLRGKVTMLLVTHSLAQSSRLADEIALLWFDGRCGRLVERQATAGFLAAPQCAVAKAFVAGGGR